MTVNIPALTNKGGVFRWRHNEHQLRDLQHPVTSLTSVFSSDNRGEAMAWTLGFLWIFRDHDLSGANQQRDFSHLCYCICSTLQGLERRQVRGRERVEWWFIDILTLVLLSVKETRKKARGLVLLWTFYLLLNVRYGLMWTLWGPWRKNGSSLCPGSFLYEFILWWLGITWVTHQHIPVATCVCVCVCARSVASVVSNSLPSPGL